MAVAIVAVSKERRYPRSLPRSFDAYTEAVYTPEQEFVFHAAPPEWMEYAEELKSAADALFDLDRDVMVLRRDELRGVRTHSTFSRPSLLLAALATENALKSIAVARHPELVRDGRIGKPIETHNLVNLANDVIPLPLSEDESALCALLTELIPYWGRYPVPLRAARISKEIPSSAELKARIDAFFSRLRKVFDDAVKAGWNGPHDMTMGPTETITPTELMERLRSDVTDE